MGACANCGQEQGRLVRGRCNTCYRFHRRTGRDRDREQIVRTNALRLEHELTNPHLLRLRYQITSDYVRDATRDNHHDSYDAFRGLRTSTR